jgi:hypothetical protein
MEDVEFLEKKLDSQIREWTNCTLLDEKNWNCQPTIAEEQNRIWMRDGVLYQQYWTESRTFKTP